MNVIYFNKFISEATKTAREHDTPISGSFELTPLCNLDCKMCYVHLTDPTVKERMLSGDECLLEDHPQRVRPCGGASRV